MVFVWSIGAAHISFAQSARTEPLSGPRIRIASEEIDLGAIEIGKPIAGTFRIENTGTAPLELRVKHLSCGCITDLPGAQTLAPGEMIEQTMSRKADDANLRSPRTGQLTATIETNDPARLEMELRVKYQEIPRLYVEPSKIEFGRLAPGETRSVSVSLLHSPDADSFTVLEVRNPSPSISVEPTAFSSEKSRNSSSALDGEGYLVKLTAPEGPASFRSMLWIETDLPGYSLFEIPISAEIQTILRLEPEALSFGVMRPPASLTKSVELAGRFTSSLSELRTECEDERLRARILARDKEAPPRLEVTLSAKGASGRMKTDIQILDGENRVMAVLPVYAMLAPADEEH